MTWILLIVCVCLAIWIVTIYKRLDDSNYNLDVEKALRKSAEDGSEELLKHIKELEQARDVWIRSTKNAQEEQARLKGQMWKAQEILSTNPGEGKP